MTDETYKNQEIITAVESATSQHTKTSIKKTCQRQHRITKQLKQYYLKTNNSTAPRAGQDEWLCDNYYVLEKESKQSLTDIRRLAKTAQQDELEWIYQIFSAVLTQTKPAICDETITLIISQSAQVRPISEKQFSFIPSAIKSILVDMAYRACLLAFDEEMISYAIISLSKLGAVDIESIVKSCSGVEQVLSHDPSGVYKNMSSETRQHYRHLIAVISSKNKKNEEETAKELLEKCKDETDVKAHIGYHILNHSHIKKPRLARGRVAIIAGIALPLLISIFLAVLTRNVWLMFLSFLPLWEICRTPIHQAALAGLSVDFIPRMNLKKVENKPKTVVLVSTLLPKASDAKNLKQRLVQLYFSNSDPDMYYCILADLGEWAYPTDEKDDSQIEATRKVIEELNKEYSNRFMLFLRSRTYNKTQQKYSGWERKRGAITEFVRYLKGEAVSLNTFVGDEEVLPKIKYLIALDSDTSLLYECAQTLVSAAIHPLNRPVIGADGIVVSGYGILAPKISASLDSARETAFSRVMTGCGGVTAYDTKDKDFYQDLFFDSIFAGKGLIDVDSFHQLLSNHFPENQILSHDILEGAYLRVGFVSDAEMTDTAPRNLSSWLSRLHRWIRGDWQNITFTADSFKIKDKEYQNPISTLSKYKLFDNLRRSLTPVAAFLAITTALFTPPPISGILALVGLLAVTFASIWSAVWSVITGGMFTLSRKFFTRTLPHTLELLGQAAMFLIMLPSQSLVTIDAALRSLWRTFLTRKKMLEWTTAAQSDVRKITFKSVVGRFWIAEIYGFLYYILSYKSPLSIFGLAFMLVIPVAYFTAKPSREDKHSISSADRDTLISYNAAMWRYYEDFANKENNYLPPDNVQQSPVYRVANRTSPTNIGMMLLSILSARDLDFIDTNGLYRRVDRTLNTIEKLKTWNGNLYNWYDTLTLDTLKPEFISSVDSGNYICCLVALAQGLREFVGEKPEFERLINRVEKIIEATDLTTMYNKKNHLFSIGYDIDADCLSHSHYDFLMSEARLTSYYSVARKNIGKRHWGTLNRTMSRCNSYAGAVSWTGTMFEYFMPHLLLPVYEGSLLGEALLFCLYCQKRRVKGLGVPWGISESAFYAFDNNLNYQYKAHGVQKLGVKRYLDKELVISPYSTFITIPFNPNSSMKNLYNLQELGVYGRYGFFEAVDFSAQRVGPGALSVTRSYMAHHIGMSMVSSCNALFENRMQKRFMRDNYMKSAGEFLQEKITKNTVVYDELGGTQQTNDKVDRNNAVKDQQCAIYPQSPRCIVLTNGEITDVLTDTGAGYLKFGDIDLTRRSTDLLRRPQGLVALVRMGGNVIPATQAPFYNSAVDYSVEYSEESVTYFARLKEVEVGMKCMIHPTISCEQRHIVVKNNTGQKQLAQVLLYFEPILSSFIDYNAHPAYSKLFVGAKYDKVTKTLTFSRRNRDSTVDMFLTVGFLEDIDFSFETRREFLQSAPNGLDDLLHFYGKNFSNNGGGVPDACCALKFDMLIGANSRDHATLLLCASKTQAEGISGIVSMRKIGILDSKNSAVSPLLGDTLEGKLGCAVLGQILYTETGRQDNLYERKLNKLGQSALWVTGVSGDLPIVLVELLSAAAFDATVVQSYLKLHTMLRSIKIEFDLVILYDEDFIKEEILKLLSKNSVGGILGSRGGIFVIKKGDISPETVVLIRAVSRHSIKGELPDTATPTQIPYRPIDIRKVQPAPMPESPDLEVEGGSFVGDRFYVDKISPLPYSHILSNPIFGTLLSDKALGYTWAINSRENKLTPWYNDICTDNQGEMLLVDDGSDVYNLINGSRASFSKKDARYNGNTEKFISQVTVSISKTGCAKYIDLIIENPSDKQLLLQCSYYTEPVLAVNRESARYIQPNLHPREGVLVLENPFNTAVNSCSALAVETDLSSKEKTRYTTNRTTFLCGDWSGDDVVPNNDPCAAVIVPISLAAQTKGHLRFILSYGKTPQSALYMATKPLAKGRDKENKIVINTPDKHLDTFINHFAPHQILSSRIEGRTAFYQCGGAFGFRDQLQDIGAYMLINPEVAYRQIVRCCGVQFEEGDVLHWWHNLPGSAGGLKGVRTKFSDDLLWLPLMTGEYIKKTGDNSILDVKVKYLKADVLSGNEHEKYLSPQRSELGDDVYSHCVLAIEKGYNLDERGLPLIGCGDWNDGFSSVGLEGKGSSVWLALFLVIVLEKFADVCDLRGAAGNETETQRAALYRKRAADLRQAVDTHCWDGNWYIRAFFDNGEKMGSATNAECSIDLLPQSFAVLGDMPDKKRVSTALDNVCERLLDERLRLVKLFDKPFQNWHQQPGYVKAYPSGIRENGGQYTHAAVWFALALFKDGRVDEGFKVLQMLNPVDRASHKSLSQQYKVEPYYMAADIYTNPSAPGRGGWSIYTGAASWYYRLTIEELLGVKFSGESISFKPKFPSSWAGAELLLTIKNTELAVTIQKGSEESIVCDGKRVECVALDGKAHSVVVTFGAK